jgi:putative ABC transport system permease protein
MKTLLMDIRHGLRFLMKAPGFTVIALLTLTLGIGMNVAIFSVFNAVLLRPLPFPQPEKLVAVSATVKRESLERRPTSYPDFLDWQRRNSVFEQMAAYAYDSLTLNDGTGAEQIQSELVSSSYFQLLGVHAFHGRTFRTEEDRMPAASAVAVVSYDFWKRRFGSDPALVGKSVRLNNKNTTIIGILPKGFYGLNPDAEVWIPFSTLTLFMQTEILENRGARWHDVIARLKPGVTIQQAEASMNSIAKRLQEEYPDTNLNYGVMLISFSEEILGNIKPAIRILFGAVAFVLLIACANVANLMLVRTSARQKEFAVRTALGASRSRIIRQLITESALLGIIGGVTGSLLSIWAIHLMKRFTPVTLPEYVSIGIDSSVLIFSILLSLATGLFIGLVGAFHVTRHDPQGSLKDAAVQSTETRSTKSTRGILVISETALALILLVGSGLMIQSLRQMQQIPIGFKKDHLLTMLLSLQEQKYSEGRSTGAIRQIIEQIEALPSIRSAAVASIIPFGGSYSAAIIRMEHAEGESARRIYRHAVTTKFFATLGIPIINGRAFSNQDTKDAPLVAIVSEHLARKFWGNQNPIGQRFKFGRTDPTAPWITVVGVAANVKNRALINDPLLNPDDPDLYLPFEQRDELNPFLVIRTVQDPASMTKLIKNEIQKIDRDIPVYEISTMDELVSNETARSRFNAFLMSIFAGFALLLASIGLYGVLSYAVTQRTREIGLRIALGAQRKDVFVMVLQQALIWMTTGIVIGLFGATILSRLLTTQLFEVSPTNPAIYASLTSLLLTVAIIATCIPATRASRVDPIVALRYE